MNYSDLPAPVIAAFDAWLKASVWDSCLTRSQRGKLGAAKRKLNTVLRLHNLTFRQVAELHL